MTLNKPTIVFITSYPPRECGIATFTQDLLKYSQKILGKKYNCKVAAMNLSPLDTYKYPSEVKWRINQNSKSEYVRLAKEINKDSYITDVIIQHEYGIFGGPNGEKILHFMKNCKKPIIVTLHTVIPSPGIEKMETTAKLIELARKVVVLTKSSKEILGKLYPQSIEKIVIIPHGIHHVPFSSQEVAKKKLGLGNHIILSTFGLLSRRKGLEHVISALPPIVKKYPTVRYLILGETHPVTRRKDGEEYRLALTKLSRSLGLSKFVKFYDQYLNLHDLLTFLQATNIYMSTSINLDQAVSGTLSYALGTGRTVISTNFAYAKEIVTPDVGRLVSVKNSPEFTSSLFELLGNNEKLKQMNRAAYDQTRNMLWENVAKKYTDLLA